MTPDVNSIDVATRKRESRIVPPRHLGSNFGRQLSRLPGDRNRNESRTSSHESLGVRDLYRLIEDVATNVNHDIQQRYGITGLVDSECRLSPSVFTRAMGGIYQESTLVDHAQQVNVLQAYFATGDEHANMDDPAVQERVASWNRERYYMRSTQAELMIQAVLHRILGDRFIVVRTAEYDDYVNGIDIVLLDKTTGESVCAFDAVASGTTGTYLEHKREKSKQVLSRGGATLRYGIGLDQKKQNLLRQPSALLPVCYIPLSHNDQAVLRSALPRDINAPVSVGEGIIFRRCIDSLQQQYDTMVRTFQDSRDAAHRKTLESNIATMGRCIATMRSMAPSLPDHVN